MTIDVSGPDGSSFAFPDGTPEATITDALSAHYGPPPSEGLSKPELIPEAVKARYDRADPRFSDGSAAAALRGVPVLGPMVTNKAAAAISSAAHPVTGVGSDKPSFRERYQENLAQEDAAQADYEKEHPIEDAIAGGIGGTIALGGAGGAIPGAAKVLGMTGKVLPAMRNAALSGSAISAADAAARGGDPTTGAVTGALTGAGGVLAGKLIGKGADVVGRAFNRDAPQATRFMDVNGEQVPVRESVLTQDPDTSRTEQTLLKSGAPAALQGEEGTEAAMGKVHSDLSAGFNPTGQSPAATPLEAGSAVANDLVSQEQARAAAEVARIQQTANETAGIRTNMDTPQTPQPAPLDLPGPRQVRPAPEGAIPAAQSVSDRIRSMFTGARALTGAAYDRAGAVPGEFNPRHLLGSGEAIRLRLNNANDRVRISPDVTPQASSMLRTIDEEVGGLRMTNDAARGARPILAQDIEQARKALVIQRRAANTAARTTGNWEDARAAGRVMDEFDNHIARVVQRRGGFSGNARDYLQAQAEARAAHTAERRAFSRQGPGDKVGTAMEGIVGKYPGQEMTPEKIISTVLGRPDSPGGAEHSVALLTHLRDTMGANSPEWAGLRKAAISHFTQAEPGADPVPLAKQADRMLRFLGNQRHSEALFTPAERARLQSHAQRLRAAEDPVAGKGTVDQKVDILSGRTTGEGASGAQVVSSIMSATKDAAKLATAVRDRVSPQSWALVKQAIWGQMSGAGEGMTAWGHQRTGETIAKFLNTELARAVYTPNERMLMKAIADAHHRLVPVPGTTNPSGTAHTAAKLVSGARHQLLALFGFSHGGLPGAGVALALGKALDWSIKKRAANTAERLFLGAQPKLPASTGAQRVVVPIAQGTAAQRSK